MSQRILSTIIAVSICLSCFAVDLYAQEENDDKRLEISCYFGGGGHGSEGGYGTTLEVPCFGLALEYLLTSRISVEGEINYLPHMGWPDGAPYGRYDITIMQDRNYRLLWDINLLFYFDLTKIKRPTKLFLTVGTGYMYDHVEYTVVSLSTLKRYEYGYGDILYQGYCFGAGLKVNIKGEAALRLLYKIHRFAGEDTQTNRFAIGLSYRF